MKRPPIPTEKDDAPKIKRFLDFELSNDNSYRIERFAGWEQARHYVKLNQQWLEPDLTEDPTRTPFWKPLEFDETNWRPVPVHNEMVAPIGNEVARLQGNGSRPYVKPTDDTPKLARAAKLARDLLLSKLEELRWREIQHEGTDEMVTYGTWVLKASWETDWTKTVRSGVETALKCPACDFRMADASIPRGKVVQAMTDPALEGRLSVRSKPSGDPTEPPKFRATATHCLTCQPPAPVPGLPPTPFATPELEPYTPEAEEAEDGEDHYGRPLGEDVPLGDVSLRNVSVFDAKPENHGLGDWNRLTEWGEERVESLDWVANHYPDKAGEVDAMDPSELMRWHPVVGVSRHMNGGGASSDPSMFSHHCVIREWHKKPWMVVDPKSGKAKLNKGRSIIVAGASGKAVVLLNADFLVQCLDPETGAETGKLLPRVHYEYIPWEIKTKEVFGLSASELLISAQDSVNTLISQVQDARHRFGSPKLLAEEGMDLMYSGFADTGYNSDVYYYRPGANEDAKPIPFGNQQMSPEWHHEYEIYKDSMSRTIGVTDAETGFAPNASKSDWSAQALMYLGEKSSERRKNRIDRIREAKKRIYRFMLQWMQEGYVEERPYTTKTENERLSVRALKGVDLCDQNEVEIDDEPSYDARTVRRAAMDKALELGTIIPDTAAAKRKINREIGAPLDINEDQNKQVERACDEWLSYYEDGREPAILQRADDPVIHFQQHMLDLMSDEAQKLRDSVDWNQVELAIWGWDEDFDALMAQEAMFKAQPIPDTPPAPQPNPIDGGTSPEDQAAAVAIWQKQREVMAIIAAMPRALELRIFEFMKKRLLDSGILSAEVPGPLDPMTLQPTVVVQVDMERQETAHKLMRFIAHAEAHYRLSGMGQGMPAPPGGVETPQGTVPGAGQPAIPGPGAGPGATTAAGSGGAPS